MNHDLEKSLRSALRPVDPGEKFTRSVMARVATDHESGTGSYAPRPRATALRWMSVAVATSLLIGFLVAREWHIRRTQRGLEARAELIQALELTGENLEIAYRAIKDEERPGSDPDSGV
jgi:hypothetical protein